MEQEIWKSIDGFELYQVSSFGRVKSSWRRKAKFLKLASVANGYSGVSLHSSGVAKSFRVCRLVAISFIPNPDNKPHVNHKDGNKKNDHVSNLEWVTASENLRHAYATELRKNSDYHRHRMLEGLREKRGKRVFKYDLLGNFIAEYRTTFEAAQSVGGRQNNVSMCCLGKYKSVKGFVFKYEHPSHPNSTRAML